MCIGDKQQFRSIKKRQLDVNYFTDYYPDEIDSKLLSLHTEDLGVFRNLFKNDISIKASFNKLLNNGLQWLYISDRSSFTRFDSKIVMTFLFPKTEEEMINQLEFPHLLISRLAVLKISNTVSKFNNILNKESFR